MNPRPGKVWLADLGLAAKTCPVMMVSRYDPSLTVVGVMPPEMTSPQDTDAWFR